MRESGMLLHISSLPEKGGIGTLGQAAYDFVDFLQEAGMRIWQVLPVGPIGFGESPYQSTSTFAGNPLLIDLAFLEKDGILPSGAFRMLPDSDQVDFDAVRFAKEKALRKAFEHAPLEKETEAFAGDFPWVEDYALFMALKENFGGRSVMEWPEEIRLREENAMEACRQKLKDEIKYHKYVQYLFFRQWFALKKYANEKGIRLFGDMPIYVAEDSADLWANPEIFQLDAEKRPVRVAGVPPDYFSEDGQLWGNPLYDWEKLKKRKFDWWIGRLNAMGRMYDLLRVDHFIGFANYYAIPYGAKNARVGEWIKAPGIRFFLRVKKEVKGITIIAEDLGEVNRRVKRLLRFCGYPGMKVLTFGFDGGRENPHRPEHYGKNAVAYTGTHDNDTVMGFWDHATEQQKENAKKLLGLKEKDDIAMRMIREVFASRSERAIIPMQDFLRLGSEGRMNIPGTVGGNWRWRMTKMPTEKIKNEIRTLNDEYDRGGSRKDGR